jgi:hypothetical protein
MNVGSNYMSQEYVPQQTEFDEDGEGLVDAPKGRSHNYT